MTRNEFQFLITQPKFFKDDITKIICLDFLHSVDINIM